MAGLFGELQRTAQAINAQSQGIYTAGRNMANVNNPAYARQRVQLGDRGTIQSPLGPQGTGVEALALQNVRDTLLDRQLIRETSYEGSLRAESDLYRRLELALGEQIDRQGDAAYIDGATASSSTRGVGQALEDLLNAFSSLAASPRSDAERQVLFQKAQSLVNRTRAVDGRLAQVRSDLDDSITADVKRINDLLANISSLNQKIGRFEVGGAGSALDLRDQRQAQLEELAQYIDFEVEEVSGSAGQIRIVSRDASDSPVVLLDRANTPPAVGFDGTTVSGGSPATGLQLRAGSVHGALVARDGVVADVRAALDALARQIVTSVNGAYNPGGASTDFFAAGGTTAATLALDPSLGAGNIRATNTGEPGANEVALAIANLAGTAFSTGSGDAIDGTFSAHYRGIVSATANAAASAASRYEDQVTMRRMVNERRDAVSGVSLDEEMTDLIKYQRAYDASARVLRVMDEMLDVVVNGLIR